MSRKTPKNPKPSKPIPQQPQQPRARKASDDVYNARRRAKRYQQRLQRDIDSGKLTPSQLSHASAEIVSLEKQIRATYSERGKAVGATQKAAAKDLASHVETMRSRETASREQAFKVRRDAVYKAEMGRAYRGDTDTSFGAGGAVKVELFWKATRTIWKGEKSANREQAILTYYGVDTLEEAYEKVMSDESVAASLDKIRKREEYLEEQKRLGVDSSTLGDMQEADILPDEEFAGDSPTVITR